MVVVDSKKDRVLTQKEILEVVGANIGFGVADEKYIVERTLHSINDPMKNQQQYGNTIFVTTHTEKMAQVEVFTADTAINFVDSCLRYYNYMQSKGVKAYLAIIEGSLLRAVKIFQRYARKANASVKQYGVAPTKRIVIVAIGDTPIVRRGYSG